MWYVSLVLFQIKYNYNNFNTDYIVQDVVYGKGTAQNLALTKVINKCGLHEAFPAFASKKDLKRLPSPRIRGVVASKTVIVCSFNHYIGATGKQEFIGETTHNANSPLKELLHR